jgi:hypothetical protein
MKKKPLTYTHDELVQLRQRGVISELDFIQMHPDPELQEGFSSFCGATGRIEDEDAAKAFLDYRASLLEDGIQRGDA